jgi:hypothetical protein
LLDNLKKLVAILSERVRFTQQICHVRFSSGRRNKKPKTHAEDFLEAFGAFLSLFGMVLASLGSWLTR